jgi:hypothetical protein
MVLSEEACEKGKDCENPECTKSPLVSRLFWVNKQDPVGSTSLQVPEL